MTAPGRHEAQAVLTIDLQALCDNWRILRDRAAPAECSAVVKGNAYGTGLTEAATALAGAGCRTFFVAQLSEGRRLRQALPDEHIRIFTLNGLAGGAHCADTVATHLAHRVQPVLGSFEEIDNFVLHGGAAIADLPVGIQFSTAMNRLGFAPEQAASVRARIDGLGDFRTAFIMSHFASSEIANDPLNLRQLAAFEEIRLAFPDMAASMANSSGIFLDSRPFYDLVRPGVALYGGNPVPDRPNPMQRVVRLEAPILQVRKVSPGESVGYNAAWTAERPSRLATIGVGYADGIMRAAATSPGKAGACAIVEGTPCPYAGRVSMDLIVLDITDAPNWVSEGDMAQLIGPDISLEQLAEWSGTINYEILTSLGPRYHRVYDGG